MSAHLPLKDGGLYVRRDGNHVSVVCATGVNPKFVKDRRGDWYERATGHYVHVRDDGNAVATGAGSYREIVSEAEPGTAYVHNLKPMRVTT